MAFTRWSLMPLLGLLIAAGALAGCSAGGASGSRTRGGDGQGGTGGLNLGAGGTAPGSGGLGIGGGLGTGGVFGCATTVSGTVYDPAGKLPLYNVVLYVPSEPLAPISEGAACQTCDGNFSGRPIAAALSDAAGKFVLDLKNVPQNANVPLVIQIGKWRREISIENVAPCADTPLPDGTVRLPKDRSEGNLPQIAVVRGGSDSLECLFRKIGISDAEFTTDAGDGRVHLYVNDFTDDAPTGQLAAGGNLPLAGTLYSSLDKMMGYDVVFLGCDGNGRGTYQQTVEQYGPAVFSNIQTYADRGGRIFGSHYHGYWVRTEKFEEDYGVTPYPKVVVHPSSEHDMGQDVTGDIDTSFPKGEALRDWLVAVGGSSEPGKLLIKGGEHFTDSVVAGVATPWITVNPDPNGHTGVVQYLSLTTPIGAPECGRMVFSDLHVGSGTGDDPELAFPNGCRSTELSPQEKALAFMLFDLSSCVQAETDPVVPPVVF